MRLFLDSFTNLQYLGTRCQEIVVNGAILGPKIYIFPVSHDQFVRFFLFLYMNLENSARGNKWHYIIYCPTKCENYVKYHIFRYDIRFKFWIFRNVYVKYIVSIWSAFLYKLKLFHYMVNHQLLIIIERFHISNSTPLRHS